MSHTDARPTYNPRTNYRTWRSSDERWRDNRRRHPTNGGRPSRETWSWGNMSGEATTSSSAALRSHSLDHHGRDDKHCKNYGGELTGHILNPLDTIIQLYATRSRQI